MALQKLCKHRSMIPQLKVWVKGNRIATLFTIIAIAIAIIGILALVGQSHPRGLLGRMGSAIGKPGGKAMIALGISFAVLIPCNVYLFSPERLAHIILKEEIAKVQHRFDK